MTQPIDDWTQDIHQGDAVETLREIPESSIHMAMCSPPYYGLRDYGEDGQIGLEDSLDEYIDELVAVADELRRVLRDDGSWWLNLGDSFAGAWGAQAKDETENNLPQHDHPEKNPARTGQLRRKSKMLVPHRVAIALQDAGWIVRSDAVWSKPNPMPHPVKDRLNEHKEFVFHLTPEPDYWFDLDAVREPHAEASISRRERADSPRGGEETYGLPENTGIGDDDLHPNGKNPGDILNVSVKAFPEAHFAVYPPELCETPIKSSCPPKVCSECGTPWSRERTVDDREVKGGVSRIPAEQREHEHVKNFNQNDREGLTQPTDVSLGDWEPGCDCEAETEPGIVLDPFAGAGTTALVAKRLGRRFAGIDLNPEYVAMAQKRVGVTVDEPERLLEDGETALTAFTDGGSFQK